MRKWKKIVKLFVFFWQRISLNISYYLFRLFPYKRNSIDWVVAGAEIASYIYIISYLLYNAISVTFEEDNFFKLKYTYVFSNSSLFSLLIRVLYSPILLGRLLNCTSGFFYVTGAGFLLSDIDGRAYEFDFIKGKNKKIICMFLGNDIRSPKKMLEYADRHDVDVSATYYYLTAKDRLSLDYERSKEMLAQSADRYADLIYNAPVDQMSYLKTQSLPFFYVYPEDGFIRNDTKYKNIGLVKIVHAPSSPITKGTQLVRAAIKKLKIENYRFQYIELINVSNAEVLNILKEAHIVLNEFYALVPGVFGIEAMANHCALLTAADCTIETSLPEDSAGAWKTTRYWEVYDNIKLLLENTDMIKEYADNGFEWVKKHWAYSIVKTKLAHDIAAIYG